MLRRRKSAQSPESRMLRSAQIDAKRALLPLVIEGSAQSHRSSANVIIAVRPAGAAIRRGRKIGV
tara:strand:- start:72 stop:266 length:195 start_codon:yes stop_codon:yes gene_type:complete